MDQGRGEKTHSACGLVWKTLETHQRALTRYIYPHSDRNPKQIRERYLNYLRADISTEKWTPEEDSRLLQLVEQHGHRWKYIEKKMKKRSQNQLKNRYYGHFKKQMRARKP